MKIVAMSDLHGYLPAEVPACDLLLLAGDLCPITNHAPAFQGEWLDGRFRYWLRSLPAKKIIGIAGNHDFVFEQEPHLVPHDLNWTYLEDSGFVWNGLSIWGTPWQPWFFNWAFNGYPDRLKTQWNLIPDNTDILVVHGPPRGFGDAIPNGDGTYRHTGCPHLLDRIKTIGPKLAVFGHIHEGRGEWQIGPTKLANVTLLDVAYRAVHVPWVFELP